MATAGGHAEPPGADLSSAEIALRRSEWLRPAGRSLAEQAADRVAGLAADLAPGTRLGTKEEMRQQCGVSVGTFNEALRLLQTRDVVTVRSGPGGGLFAASQSPAGRPGSSMLALDMSQATAADAIRIRSALDPLLIEDAVWHASPADLFVVRQHLEPMAQAIAKQDAVAYIHADSQLHAQIAAISPSQTLRSLYSGLLDLIERHLLAALPTGDEPLPGDSRELYQLHCDLVAALEARDSDAAVRLLAGHDTHA